MIKGLRAARLAAAGAVLVVIPAMETASAADCPGEAEVHAALTRYINTDYWSPSKRDTWKIKSVSNFSFGPMKVGNTVKKQVEWGKAAQEVCPVRLEYSFAVEHNDGRKEVTQMGVNKTHLFYRDPFNDWIFKTD